MKELIIKKRKEIILVSLLVIIFISKIITIISFNDTEWEPDSYMHFLELRTVYANFPDNLGLGLNVWSKPLYIYPLALIVAIFNIKTFFVIEVVNILIFLLIAFIVYKIVYKLYGNFSVAIAGLLLTSLSLTLFKSSVSVLTEPIFTLTLVISFYTLIKKKYLLSSLFIGLCVLARIEGLFFIALYLLYIAYDLKLNLKKLFLNALVTAIPFFVWNFAGFLVSGEILYFKRFFQSYSAGDYGHGSLLSYPKLFITKEFILSVLFISALVLFIKYFKKVKNQGLIIYSLLTFSLFVFIQAILWWKGSFGTAGLMRYFVSVIPFMIIFICFMFAKLKDLFGIKLTKISIVVAAVLQSLLIILYLNGIIVSTKEFPKVENYLIQAGKWIEENQNPNELVAADRPEILYYSKRNLTASKIYFEEDYKTSRKGLYIWTGWSPITNNLELTQIQENKNAQYLFNIGQEAYFFRID